MDNWVRTGREDQETSFLSERLTIREREVLKLTAVGKSGKEIGDLLLISVRTVERHRSNFMKKLNVKKTVDLVKYVIPKRVCLTSSILPGWVERSSCPSSDHVQSNIGFAVDLLNEKKVRPAGQFSFNGYRLSAYLQRFQYFRILVHNDQH
jgi:DNA-binding CsgD family transcriptional regulator